MIDDGIDQLRVDLILEPKSGIDVRVVGSRQGRIGHVGRCAPVTGEQSRAPTGPTADRIAGI